MNVSVAEAKNKLTRLIQRAEKGERVTICRHGVPVVDLVPTARTERKPRQFGTLKNKIKILDPDWANPQSADDYVRPPAKTLSRFEGYLVNLGRGKRPMTKYVDGEGSPEL